MLRWFWNRVYRNRILSAVEKGEAPAVWPLIRRVWTSAPCIAKGPVGAAAVNRLEYLIAKGLGKDDRGKKLLRDNIGDPSPTVCAYCLIGLCESSGADLADAVGEVRARTEQVIVMTGCFSHRTTLSEFAQSLVTPSPTMD